MNLATLRVDLLRTPPGMLALGVLGASLIAWLTARLYWEPPHRRHPRTIPPSADWISLLHRPPDKGSYRRVLAAALEEIERAKSRVTELPVDRRRSAVRRLSRLGRKARVLRWRMAMAGDSRGGRSWPRRMLAGSPEAARSGIDQILRDLSEFPAPIWSEP